MENSVAGDAGGRRNEIGEAIVDFAALSTVRAREKMPECEAIPCARFRENVCERSGAAILGFGREIKIRKSGAERFGRVLEVGRARANLGPRGTEGAGWNQGLAAVEMKAYPAESGANRARTVRSNLQRVRTTKIDGHSRWRVDNKLASRRPDHGVNHTDIELNPLVMIVGLQKTNTGVGLDLDLTEVRLRDAGA